MTAKIVLSKKNRDSFGLIVSLWNETTLVTRFMLLAASTIFALSFLTDLMIERVASQSLLESSLEIEMALARTLVEPIIGDQPITSEMSRDKSQQLDKLIGSGTYDDYLSKIKIWNIHGQLVYDSQNDLFPTNLVEPAVVRAMQGETVVSLSDFQSKENVADRSLGSTVYEVYTPIYNSNEELLAIVEVYCSVSLISQRLKAMNDQIDKLRYSVILLSIILTMVLIYFAQMKINLQEKKLNEQLLVAERLASKNQQLWRESEEIRKRSATASEEFLSRVGSELHDGPIQLLSLSELYRNHENVEKSEFSRKASSLFDQALHSLRNISVGLILPELNEASLQTSLKKAAKEFSDNTGYKVNFDMDEKEIFLSSAERIVAYRVVQEALCNSGKHANANGLTISQQLKSDSLVIMVTDNGRIANPTQDDHDPNGSVSYNSGLGLLTMKKRAQSVGGSLETDLSDSGMVVRLTLPRSEPH